MSVPILMITYDRLEYTQTALRHLLDCQGVTVIVIDNGSKDGTAEWLQMVDYGDSRPRILLNKENKGIAGAMNQFLTMTWNYDIVGKVDNDTVVNKMWMIDMLPSMKYADIIQSKHKIIPATHPEGWDGFTRTMKKDNGLIYNHYVGGSGILFKRKLVHSIPETDNKIMGWRKFQEQNPKLRKAFVPSVEIKLLDEDGYNDYPEYYKQTGRI